MLNDLSTENTQPDAFPEAAKTSLPVLAPESLMSQVEG